MTKKQDDSRKCNHGEPVSWNPWNKVVQCHKCGEIFISTIECKEKTLIYGNKIYLAGHLFVLSY